MADSPELDIRAALDRGLVPRFEVERRFMGEGWLIRAQAVDPAFPRRKPARLFPVADVLCVATPSEGLELLARMFEAALPSDAVVLGLEDYARDLDEGVELP